MAGDLHSCFRDMDGEVVDFDSVELLDLNLRLRGSREADRDLAGSIGVHDAF